MFVKVSADQHAQNGMSIGKKLATLGVDQKVDQRPFVAESTNSPTTKKARVYGLFGWSECTDLNRGPLVPQTSALTRLSYTPMKADSSKPFQILQALQ
jgi:hypothetical protein